MGRTTKLGIAVITLLSLVIAGSYVQADEQQDQSQTTAEQGQQEDSSEQDQQEVTSEQDEQEDSADEQAQPGPTLQGMIRVGYGGFFVSGDEGRFREDHYRTDESTGGIDWLSIRSTGPDANGYEFSLEGRGLYDYDYRLEGLLRKRDSHYISFEFTGFRRYYDGSNEYWDPTLYLLSPSFAEFDDDTFKMDRRNYNVEIGLTPPEGPQLVVGWHRFVRKGDEVLLRGARARIAGDPVPRFRGIPALAAVDGITDTIYAEISHTFAEKYNLRIRQEFEEYHDKQLIVFPRYNNGAVEQARTFRDDPGYQSWTTLVMFDSFLDEQTYVTGNYMYNHIRNDSDRDSVRTNLPNPNHFVNTSVNNRRDTHAWAGGFRRANLLPNLHLSGGVRVQQSNTQAESNGLSGAAATPRAADTGLDELQVGETVRVVYQGIPRTTISFDADLEQRNLGWEEFTDTQSHEIFTNFGGPAFVIRATNINYVDQTYTMKAVHRINSAIKATAKFRIKDLRRDYGERFDNDLTFFPGSMGDYRISGNDLTFSTDWRVNSRCSTTFMYQFINENISTQLADAETQNFNVQRFSGSLTLNPVSNLALVGTFMAETYRLRTPGTITAGFNNIAPGRSPYDYDGDSYTIALDGTYAFNNRVSAYGRYQHTEATGGADYGADYGYDQATIGLKFKPKDNQTIHVAYQLNNFNNQIGGDFDDYIAHGILAYYEWRF